MWERRSLLLVAAFLLLLHCGRVTAQTRKSPWLTLSGNAPSVVAKGGFSGLFPDSSQLAYQFTYQVSSPDTISWCDVQLTKDGVGICIPSMLLDNCTNIKGVYPDASRSYSVNGVPMTGWFSIDYDFDKLSQVAGIQSTFSRTDRFDSLSHVFRVEDVKTLINTSAFWLNLQHDKFYSEHNLSMRSYLRDVLKKVDVNYVSSPEVAFLSWARQRFKGSKTKLVFRFLDQDVTELSTNQTYGSLLKNLTFIKTFASGILVPKNYIWPLTSDLYLQPHTSVVLDAHKEGLEVFASDFANDAAFSYNYSYDPLAEYLNFVDNGVFSVDGVLTDFPISASEAIGCFSHVKNNFSEHEKPLVITHNGASGIYPDCTDLAYKQTTTVTTSPFRSRSSVISQLQAAPGIFTFNFTWDEIQKNLKPAISTPEPKYGLVRNPRYKNAGNFMKLSDFLTNAEGKALSGILISVENAAFFAEKLGYSITDAIIKALKDSDFDNQTAQEVMIQSANSSVLMAFKQQTNYKLVYKVDETIGDADASSLADIKKFATYIAVEKKSIYPVSLQFIEAQTDLIKTLQSAGFPVFVYVLRNEFPYQPWDFFSDPTVEINSFVQGTGVDGIITEFPGTATRYKRNSCLKLGDNKPTFMIPVQVGGLLSIMDPSALPPALAPLPVLDASDVVEPPLPPASSNPNTTTPATSQAGNTRCAVASFLLYLAISLLSGCHILS